MAKICLVTDSTADIPKELLEELEVTIVPLKVHVGEETFLDGVTITSAEFYKKLPGLSSLPTTSQPSPADFADTYQALAEKYGEDVQILSIHLSAALSGTYQSAVLAKSMAEGLDIEVLDSKKASYALGQIVINVARAIRDGKSREECIRLAKRMIDGQQVYFIVDTLHYLQKGGRIGKASAILGTLLNVKPILSLDQEGEVYVFDKVRGTKKAVKRILDHLEAFAEGEPVQAAVLHSDLEGGQAFMDQIQAQFHPEELVFSELGPVIGTHTGPGLIGVVMIKKKDVDSDSANK